MTKSESTLPYMTSCGHARLQGADQLHGVCIFCYRNRLAAVYSELADIKRAMAFTVINIKKEKARQVWNDAIYTAIDEAIAEYNEAERKAIELYVNTGDINNDPGVLIAGRIVDRISDLLHKKEKNHDQRT